MIFRKVLLTSFVFNVFFIGGCRVQSSAEEFSDPRIETHYSPNENLEAFDNRLIRSAHRSVDICAFAFTDHELAEALIAVAARGVKVRLYLDQGQTHGELAREERGGRTSRTGGTEDDVIDGQLDADSLKRRMEAIRHANQQIVGTEKAKETFWKLLQKGESEAAAQAFDSPDIYNLPAGNTNWRLSNAISWIAGQTKDAERKLDLMKIAGEVLPKVA